METLLRLAFDSMEMTTMLLGAFLVACALFSDPGIRRFVMLSIALSCMLNAAIGVAMKFSDPLMHVFWKPLEIDWNNFAFYRYHGNAGAFLNLGWPIILVFARRALSAGRGKVSVSRRIFWIFASLACFSALFLNASKAALAIGLLIAPWPFSTGLKRMKQKTLFLLAAVALLLLAGGLFASSQFAREAAFQRMTNRAEVSASFYGRVTAYHQFIDAVPQVGAFGLGPGLFQVAFPYQTSPLGNRDVGLREYAHEDYLQTALEWGWFGTFFWTLLVGGGIYRAFHTYAQRERFASKTDRHLVLGAILGVLGTLAQATLDFPLQIASIRLVFLVLLAFCWASPRLLNEEETEPRLRHYWLPVPARFASKKQVGRKPVTTNSPGR
jgi:O-antigen ligase